MKKKKQTSYQTLTSQDLNVALLEMETYFEQAMTRFVLLGETLKSVKLYDCLSGDKLELGVFANTLTPEVLSLFKQWKFEVEDKLVKFKIGKVPVEIKIIKRQYPFMKYLDVVWYRISQYLIPNPWKNAYIAKGLIR